MEEEGSTCSSLSSLTEPPRAWAGLRGPSTEGTELTPKGGVNQQRTASVLLRSWRVHDSELGLFALTPCLAWMVKKKTGSLRVTPGLKLAGKCPEAPQSPHPNGLLLRRACASWKLSPGWSEL